MHIWPARMRKYRKLGIPTVAGLYILLAHSLGQMIKINRVKVKRKNNF